MYSRIKTESDRFPPLATKITYSNLIELFENKFPESFYRVLRLKALYSGIAYAFTDDFFSQVDSLFAYNEFPFHQAFFNQWENTGCHRTLLKIRGYGIPSFEDGSKEARELNSKLIEKFFEDNKLFVSFLLLEETVKNSTKVFNYRRPDFLGYIEVYYTVCIKIGILKNDSELIKGITKKLKAHFSNNAYQVENCVFNAVFSVLGTYSIDESWFDSRDNYIKNLFYNTAVYALINYAYYDPVVFSKPFDETIFTRFESFNAPLIFKALCGDRVAAVEFIDKEKNGQKNDQKQVVLQNKLTLCLLHNLKDSFEKQFIAFDKIVKGRIGKIFSGKNFGAVCACIGYLKYGTPSQKEFLSYTNMNVNYSEFQVADNLGNGLSGFFSVKALYFLDTRDEENCESHLHTASSGKYFRKSNFFDIMLLVASKIRCDLSVSDSEQAFLLNIYNRISKIECFRNLCASLIINSNLYTENELSGIHVNLNNGEEPFDLINIIEDVPEWQFQINNLIDIFKVSTNNTVAPVVKKDRKLIWVVTYDGLALNAFEKDTDSNGEVCKGKQLSLYQLMRKTDEFAFLSKDDKLIISEIQRIYDLCHDTRNWNRPDWISAKEVLTEPMIKVLHSIKGLYIDSGYSIQPLKIIKSALKCNLSEENGKINLVLDQKIKDRVNMFNDSEKDLIIKNAPDEIVWYHIGRPEMQAADILYDGITLPKKEFNKLIPLCFGNTPVLSISGDVKTSEVDANSRIVIQMEHKNDTFYGLVGVKPFGKAKSPLYQVASGPVDPIYNFVQTAEGANDQPLNSDSMSTIKCHRDFALEKASLDKLINACPTFADNYEQGYLSIDNLETTLKLLEELEQSDAEYSLEWAKGNKIKISKPIDSSSVHLKITKSKTAGEWFGISGNLEISKDRLLSIQSLLNSLRGSRFVEINEGEYIALTDKLRKKLATLKMLASDEKGKDLQVSALVTQAVEQAIEDMDVEADPVWNSSVERMKKAFASTPALPKGLQAQLRDYQVEGYEWMQRLAIWGVGACLADDMGLGKTVQTIAVLLNQSKEGPCLVMAPTSVGQNWKQELEKFAPSLNVKRFEARGREALVKSLGKNDVLIVGYGLLNNVEKYLSSITWSMVVFDEAQALKNFDTKRAKAGKKIPANFRLALTGTPIENRIEDLWALFNNINPGLLGSWEGFHEKFKNIEPGSSGNKTLKTMIKPFLLRRLKSSVLDELPSRTEQNIIVEMNDAEKVFYEDLRSSLVNELENTEARNRKFLILAGLTKLRRACCHPQLVNADMENLEKRSSKIDRFVEILKNLIEGGHKVLAFSQFTSFLALIEDALKEENIAYQYLDGQTPEKEREKRIESFQNGDGDVFLLSLKAGGTGINLTAADYVIHLDPWWNPAVEDQASDRAHRLGQKRPVTIYRLVSESTVEEKILALHAQKRELAADFLEGTSSSIKKMTEDDLMALLKS